MHWVSTLSSGLRAMNLRVKGYSVKGYSVVVRNLL